MSVTETRDTDGGQIFPFGETLEIVSMFTNNHDGTNINGGNPDWAWNINYGTCSRTLK